MSARNEQSASAAWPSGRPAVTAGELADRLRRTRPGERACATHALGSIAAIVGRRLVERGSRRLVFLTADLEGARALHADLRFTLGEQPVPLLVEPPEASAFADVLPDRRSAHARLAALFVLARAAEIGAEAPLVAVVPAPALARKVVPAARVRAHAVKLGPGDAIDRDALCRRLTELGYQRVPLVEDPATFAPRGALLDAWSPGEARPLRIQLDGDHIETVRAFNPADQRSLAPLVEAWLVPAHEPLACDPEATARARQAVRELCDALDWPSARTRALADELGRGHAFFGAEALLPAWGALAPLSDQLPEDALVVVEEPALVARAVEQTLEEARAAASVAVLPRFAFDACYTDGAAIARWLERSRILALTRSPVAGGDAALFGEAALAMALPDTAHAPSLGTEDQSELGRAVGAERTRTGHGATLGPLVERIRGWHERGLSVVIAARSATQADRLAAMLSNRDLSVSVALGEIDRAALLDRRRRDGVVAVVVGSLHRGVVAPLEGLALCTEEEIFGTRAHRRGPSAVPRGRRAAALLEDLRALAPGDHVVHAEHGVGRYQGLVHSRIGGHTVDLLQIEYAGGDKLYLPVYRLNLVERLLGAEGTPRLDQLGGKSFARTKARAARKAQELADELLRLYAERQAASGERVPLVDDAYRAFEAAFPYEETDDQARAIAEVGADLEVARPMDRLVCGDVGFGKTEVALRAAFRVAMAGRQVAVLCPTTVLAQQHARTFEARLAPYPLVVATLSRFQSERRQDEVVRALKQGRVDVVIGTHRLLSRDVHFKALGLLVIDEEQRFGVTAKERIKRLKTEIDVLTLTATPIPRTLQMAIGGLRDLSLIGTPPADRRAVRTVVARHDPGVIAGAIQSELARGGQVYYVYNRVQGLEARAAAVGALVPHARVATAHGQMSERLLERTMLDFVEGRFDVLCSTAIVENGLDIPRCNTILIDRADMFGLAQLYQLRGRVGRSRERGYCYLLLPTETPLGDEARARIEALERYSDLGSGFQLAALDLDLRGAGDLLGAEQSGAVAAVGFEMFCHMLEQAVRELRGERRAPEVDPDLSFDVEALLPEGFIADVGVRLSLYKRLAGALDEAEVRAIGEEMEDRFGAPPAEARRLLRLMALKTALRALRVLGCEASARVVTLHLRDDTPLDGGALAALVARAGSGYKLTPDLRLMRRARPGERFASGLDAVDRMLAELEPCLRPGATSAPSSRPTIPRRRART
jgi:transcription-repair coupling factor (superfamily II helicase)